MALLDIRNLTVRFGDFAAVEGVDLTINAGELVGIVGESGSGKSVTSLAIMGLLASNARITADRLEFDGQDMQSMSAKQRRRIVGKDVAMIFQEPMTSLNPCFTVGFQITEALAAHEPGDRAWRHRRAVELLSLVGIPAPEDRLKVFPHQMSGGMSQRVMIAMALACNPKLLIADEPTTALDVTIQRQILDLLLELQRDRGMALMLITHDIGVVAETARRVVVMYSGQVIENRPVGELLTRPRHPYAAALLDALPERAPGGRLATIPGMVPGIANRPAGCLFAPRCRHVQTDCNSRRPMLETDGSGAVACFHPLPTDRAA